MTDIPTVDINAPLKSEINEAGAEYKGGVTPKNKFLYILGILCFVVITIFSAGIFLFYQNNFKGKSENKQVVVIESQVTPQQAETSTFDKTNITFEILNGSGVTGAAKKAADTVSGLGYKVLRTGNSEDTTSNKLYLKDQTKEFAD